MFNFFKFSSICLPILFIIYISSGFKIDPKNPPTGQTGAPNETTCSTASGCHSGGTYNGTVALTGLPNQILPSTSYNVSITLASTCVNTGFELTVLDKSNANCGTLAAGTNNNIKTAGSRVYVRQSNTTSLSGGKASYSFKWTSPAAITGDSAFFYFVMLQANGNGGKTGDNVAKGKKVVGFSSVSSTQDNLEEIKVEVYPNPTADFVNIKSDHIQPIQVKMVHPNGTEIMNFTLDKLKTLDVKALKAGIYYLYFGSGATTVSKSLTIIH